MKKSIIPLVAAAALAYGANAQATAIDLFTEPAAGQGGSLTGVTAVAGASLFSESGPHGTVLGGYRDLYLEVLSNTNPSPFTSATLGVFGGTLQFGTDPAITARGIIQWDGLDNSASLAQTGLGGADLISGCSGGCDRFLAEVLSADQGFPYEIEIWDMEGDWSRLSANTLFPVNSSTSADYEYSWFNLPDDFYVLGGLPFWITSGGSGDGVVDFDNIGALQFSINQDSDSNWGGSTTEVDLQLAGISSTNVPVPGTLLLLAAGGLIAGSVRRRKAA